MDHPHTPGHRPGRGVGRRAHIPQDPGLHTCPSGCPDNGRRRLGVIERWHWWIQGKVQSQTGAPAPGAPAHLALAGLPGDSVVTLRQALTASTGPPMRPQSTRHWPLSGRRRRADRVPVLHPAAPAPVDDRQAPRVPAAFHGHGHPVRRVQHRAPFLFLPGAGGASWSVGKVLLSYWS